MQAEGIGSAGRRLMVQTNVCNLLIVLRVRLIYGTVVYLPSMDTHIALHEELQ